MAIQDDNHAFTVGSVLGMFIRGQQEERMYDAAPIIDGFGNYTDEFVITNLHSGNTYTVRVTPRNRVTFAPDEDTGIYRPALVDEDLPSE